MAHNQRKILEMLADDKISVDEATRLLSLVDQPEGEVPSTGHGSRRQAKYLRIVVQPNKDNDNGERVNIRVPMGLLRAGIKLASLIPQKASNQVNAALQDKGLDMDIREFKVEDLEMLVDALSDLEVDVESGKEKVNIYVE